MTQTNPIKVPDFLVDVTSQTQFIRPTKEPQADISSLKSQEYVNTLEDFWRKLGLLNAYEKGLLIGKGDIHNKELKTFFKKLKRLLEEIIREELASNNKTTEDYKEDFKIIESVFNIITNRIKNDELKVNNERILATFQGFTNSYIDSIKYD